MAVSMSASTLIPSPNSELFASSSSRVSSSLPFPVGLRTRTTLFARPRIPPLAVEAKKQTFSSFEELLSDSDRPVLVDFYATWCGPCQFMVAVLEEVSVAMSEKIRVVKIDTEKNPAIANAYNIAALPTLIVFKDGQVLDRFEGAMPAQQLIQWVEEALKIKQ